MSPLQQRARESGRCPPSLLLFEGSEQMLTNEGGVAFETAVLQIMDSTGFYLRSEPVLEVAAEFKSVMERVESIDKIVGSEDPNIKKKALEYRRCLVLAIVGSTPPESSALERVLENGYLSSVKSWIDDTLASVDGSMDLLLHMLSNLEKLPVTRSIILDSGMGKAIGTVEKHALVKGTPNEAAVKSRVQQIKDSWQASVKERKAAAGVQVKETKRSSEAIVTESPPSGKKIKTEVSPKKISSFSSLLKKVSRGPNGTNASDIPAVASNGTDQKLDDKTLGGETDGPIEKKGKKKSSRVKWADHFGKSIEVTLNADGDDAVEGAAPAGTSVSGSDWKKRDRLREKEMLANAKKSKLMDDDDTDIINSMQPTASWRVPPLLPERPDVAPAQVVSTEISAQDNRMSGVHFATYINELDVPESPAPLSDVEQAMDMNAQASTVASVIPFFVPQQVATDGTPAVYSEATSQPSFSAPLVPTQPAMATLEFVQSLGLPLFLVGQSVHALQTLAQSPGLLSTLVDVNGMYDQSRLMTLVQTLSSASLQPEVDYQPHVNVYGGLPPVQVPTYGQQSHYNPSSRSGPRGGKSDEGNLYVTGFGAGITEADIITAFSPYVRTDEVVLKGTFAFVNTSDPVNAQRAREALTGTLLGGLPIRINSATRKPRENNLSSYGAPPVAPIPSHPMAMPGSYQLPATPAADAHVPIMHNMPQPGYVHPNVDSARDDRGNPATKNLFVAGYGHGTSEQQLRELVGQFAIVTGVVSKGTFAFVNTSDRSGAVLARERLNGNMYNGGVLRINFAKETGRLGTSFDLTYGPNTGPNAGRGRGPPPSNMSYYGRNGY